MFKSVNRRGEGVAPLPRRGKNDTGEGQRICIAWERATQRKPWRREGGHEFLITWERVGMEGAEAMEEGRGHDILITWERVGMIEAAADGRRIDCLRALLRKLRTRIIARSHRVAAILHFCHEQEKDYMVEMPIGLLWSARALLA